MSLGAPILLPDQFNAATYFIDRHINEGRGEKIAIESEGARFTYRELWQSVNRFGNGLRQLGVRIEERVLLLLLDGPEFAISFFGAIKIGAVPVPVNTLLKPSDYQYMLNNSRARVAVVSESLYPQIAAIPREQLRYLKHIVVVGANPPAAAVRFDDLLEQNPPELEAEPTSKDDAAFWLYSSGSTGFPKACVHLQHDMVVCAERYAKGILGMTENDRCFSAAKLFFAYGLGNALYFPLAVGGDQHSVAGSAQTSAGFRNYRAPSADAVFLRALELCSAISPCVRKRHVGQAPPPVRARRISICPPSATASLPAKPCPPPSSSASRNASAWKSSTPSVPPKFCTCSSPIAQARFAPAPADRSSPATKRRSWTKTINQSAR